MLKAMISNRQITIVDVLWNVTEFRLDCFRQDFVADFRGVQRVWHHGWGNRAVVLNHLRTEMISRKGAKTQRMSGFESFVIKILAALRETSPCDELSEKHIT